MKEGIKHTITYKRWERFSYQFKKIYYFIFRPQTRGVKCVIQNDDQILLVRPGYAHKQWTFPGGGVDNGETFEQAAIREVKEETGIALESLEKVFSYKNIVEYKNDTVEVFYARVEKPDFKIDNFEIIDASWFDLKNLPPDRMPRVDKILTALNEYKN